MPIIPIERLQQFAAVNVLSDPGAVAGPKLAPNCVQVTLVWHLTDGKEGRVVLHYRYPPPFTGTVANANTFHSEVVSSLTGRGLDPLMPLTGEFFQVILRDINTKEQAEIMSNLAPHAGTSVSTALPDEVAAVLTKRTALPG